MLLLRAQLLLDDWSWKTFPVISLTQLQTIKFSSFSITLKSHFSIMIIVAALLAIDCVWKIVGYAHKRRSWSYSSAGARDVEYITHRSASPRSFNIPWTLCTTLSKAVRTWNEGGGTPEYVCSVWAANVRFSHPQPATTFVWVSGAISSSLSLLIEAPSFSQQRS